MAKQTIFLGTVPDDGTGDPLRTSFDKCNDNFDETYAAAVEPQYFYWSGKTYRMGMRDNVLVIDTTLTPTGFAGIEGTDWKKLFEFKDDV